MEYILGLARTLLTDGIGSDAFSLHFVRYIDMIYTNNIFYNTTTVVVG